MSSRWDGRPSRHARGYGTAWTKLRLRILKRDSYLCQACKDEGRITSATSVDHIKAKSKGGTDDPGNLRALCGPCHSEKSLREAAEAQGRTYRPKPKRQFDANGWPILD